MPWLLEMVLKAEPILDKGSYFYSTISVTIKLHIVMTPTPFTTNRLQNS